MCQIFPLLYIFCSANVDTNDDLVRAVAELHYNAQYTTLHITQRKHQSIATGDSDTKISTQKETLRSKVLTPTSSVLDNRRKWQTVAYLWKSSSLLTIFQPKMCKMQKWKYADTYADGGLSATFWNTVASSHVGDWHVLTTFAGVGGGDRVATAIAGLKHLLVHQSTTYYNGTMAVSAWINNGLQSCNCHPNQLWSSSIQPWPCQCHLQKYIHNKVFLSVWLACTQRNDLSLLIFELHCAEMWRCDSHSIFYGHSWMEAPYLESDLKYDNTIMGFSPPRGVPRHP